MNENPDTSVIQTAIVLVLIGLILYLIFGRKRFNRSHRSLRISFHPELWFYSKCIDIELETVKPSAEILKKYFEEYLMHKYRLKSRKNVLDQVRDVEENPDFVEYYSNMMDDIISLKHKDKSEVIQYVKFIKKEYNIKGASELTATEDCNNC